MFLDVGINHSGLTIENQMFKRDGDFRKNFNPNISILLGAELKLKNKLYLISGIGFRKTGTRLFPIAVVTAQQPDGTGQFISGYEKLEQITIPLLIGYNLGQKLQLKPIMGFVNNFNTSAYSFNDLSKKHAPLTIFKNYTVNGMVGFTLYNKQLIDPYLGLGIKITYEKSLMEMSSNPSVKISQSILSGSILINYNLNLE
jgi:hypothetical protein